MARCVVVSWCVSRRPAVAADALRLAAAFDVGYSSQDWLVSAGTPYFVDLNPGGQWLFLPSEVADVVTCAIADWLVRQ